MARRSSVVSAPGRLAGAVLGVLALLLDAELRATALHGVPHGIRRRLGGRL